MFLVKVGALWGKISGFEGENIFRGWLMRRVILVLFSWVLCLGASAWAQSENSTAASTLSLTPTSVPTLAPTQAPALSPTASPTPFDPGHLKGAQGIGVSGTLLTYRYWTGDSTALDLFLGGSFALNSGLDFSGNNTTAPNWNYTLGVGLKQNFKEPFKGVFIQSIEHLTFNQTYNETIYTTTSYGVNYGSEDYYNQSQSVNLYLGLGFEAFVPFWENLSIEGSVGLSSNLNLLETNAFYNSNFSSQANTQTATSNFNLGSTSNAFSILNGAVHFYF